jgi:hypothetical protein
LIIKALQEVAGSTKLTLLGFEFNLKYIFVAIPDLGIWQKTIWHFVWPLKAAKLAQICNHFTPAWSRLHNKNQALATMAKNELLWPRNHRFALF